MYHIVCYSIVTISLSSGKKCRTLYSLFLPMSHAWLSSKCELVCFDDADNAVDADDRPK